MSRNTRLFLGLASAAGFYYFFGVVVLRPPGNEAYLSIVPAIHIGVTVITLALVALSIREYLRSDPGGESSELSRREANAREQIRKLHGDPSQEYGVTMFVSHHLDELDADYWRQHTGTDSPDPQQVLGLLELRIDPEEEQLDTLDFTLPGDATDYVLCVEFDESGNVVGVSMES